MSADDLGPGAIAAAAAAGDPRKIQIALRDRLADAIDNPKTSARDLAALTRRLQEVVDRLAREEAMENDERESARATTESDDSYDPDEL